jgi:hypothetical protein
MNKNTMINGSIGRERACFKSILRKVGPRDGGAEIRSLAN